MSEVTTTFTLFEFLRLHSLTRYYRKHTSAADLNPKHGDISTATIIIVALCVLHYAIRHNQDDDDKIVACSDEEILWIDPPAPPSALQRSRWRWQLYLHVSVGTRTTLRELLELTDLPDEESVIHYALVYFAMLTELVKEGALVHVPNLTFFGAHNYAPDYPAILDYADLHLYKEVPFFEA